MFCKKGVLRNLVIKHLCQSLFYNIVASCGRNRQVFSFEFFEISDNFFTEHLEATSFIYISLNSGIAASFLR